MDALIAVLALVLVACAVFFACQRWAQNQTVNQLHRGPKMIANPGAGAGTGASARARAGKTLVYENPLLRQPSRGGSRVVISALLPPVASPSELAALAQLSVMQAALAESKAQLAAADAERNALRRQLASSTAQRFASEPAPTQPIAKASAMPTAASPPHAVSPRAPAAVVADDWTMIVEDDGDVYYEHKTTFEATRDEPPSYRRARDAKAAQQQLQQLEPKRVPALVQNAPAGASRSHTTQQQPPEPTVWPKLHPAPAIVDEWLHFLEEDGDAYWEHRVTGEATRDEPPSHQRARAAKAKIAAAAAAMRR